MNRRKVLTSVAVIHNIEQSYLPPATVPSFFPLITPLRCPPYCPRGIVDVYRIHPQIFIPKPLHLFPKVLIHSC